MKIKIFDSAYSQFKLKTGLLYLFGFLVSFVILSSYLSILLHSNVIFLEANGYLALSELRVAYYDYISQIILKTLPALFGFGVLIFWAGIGVAFFLIKPFQAIADYCEGDQKEPFTLSPIWGNRFLVSFASFFFKAIEESRSQRTFKNTVIPGPFEGVRKVGVDYIFLMNLIFSVIVISVVSGVILYSFGVELQSSIADYSIQVLKEYGAPTSKFVAGQQELFSRAMIFTTLIMSSLYFILSLHLYSGISPAIYGVFTAMRSFLKGNQESRVHLLGYGHIRPIGLSINKYIKKFLKDVEK